MARSGHAQVVEEASRHLLVSMRLGGARQEHEARRRDDEVDEVAQLRGKRRELGKRRGGGGAEREAGRQADGRATRARGGVGLGVERGARQLFDPRAADDHREPERQAGEDAADEEHGRRAGADGEQHRRDDREDRRGQHERATAPAVRGGPAEQ